MVHQCELSSAVVALTFEVVSEHSVEATAALAILLGAPEDSPESVAAESPAVAGIVVGIAAQPLPCQLRTGQQTALYTIAIQLIQLQRQYTDVYSRQPLRESPAMR